MYLALSLISVAILVAVQDLHVAGHGYMQIPVNRASRWRIDPTAPINWNDNALYCGGFPVQWGQHGGRCGICGDDYGLPRPRPHEFGGVYGEGVIVARYWGNSIIPVTVNITKNHWGDFTFDLCNLDHENETDDCFRRWKLKLTDGSAKYKIKQHYEGLFKMRLQIPPGIRCKHCVLRWTYRAGNNWGICEDGTAGLGCGPQEHFRNCADIAITYG